MNTKMNITALKVRNDMKAHAVFGTSSHGDSMTYCNRRFWQYKLPNSKQKHCKQCTKELRKAGMSWSWYEKTPRRDA
jgi:hypothetical protein